MATYTNAQMEITQTVTTAESRKTNLHLFIHCTRIRKIWKHYQTILSKLTGQHYNPQKYLFTLTDPNTNKYITKLTITIT